MAQLRPTFSESWYRVADLKVKLRASAQISRQFYRGERWYVVRDPAGNQFHRLSAPAYRFIGLLDGTRTVSEAWELVGGQLADDAPTQNEVIQILSQLHSANLIESNVTPDAAVLLRRHKKMVKRQWQGRLMNILFPRIPLWDPDMFLKRWMPVMRPILSNMGWLVWFAVIGYSIFMLVPMWSRLQGSAQDAINPGNWPFLWATFVLIKLIHELGHAFTCRRFGGEVHELGVMFLVLVPAPYVDASSAWAFPNKWHRILVGAGGMIFELFVAAIMAFVWLNTAQGTLTNQLAYNAMLIASVSTVIFNANPLLRYDGYYMLSDWLEIPNLRYRSTEYTLGLIKRHLFKVKLPTPLPPVGQRIWLFTYAITSSIYRLFVGIAIILLVWNEVPILGELMAIGGVITWLVVPVVKTSKYLMIEPELHRKRGRAVAWTAGFATAAIFLIGFVKFQLHFVATGIVEPRERVVLHAATAGIVDDIKARDGQWLKQGDVILVGRDEKLNVQVAQIKDKLEQLAIQKRQAEAEQKGVAVVESEMAYYQKELKDALKRLADLTVTAPIEGRLTAPQLHGLRGKFLKQGDEIATIAKHNDLRVTTLIDQDNAALAYLEHGAEADIRLTGLKPRALFKSQSLVGRIEDREPVYTLEAPSPSLTAVAGDNAQIDPTDPSGKKLMRPQIQLWVTIDNPDTVYLPGQRAYIRFHVGEPRSIAWRLQRWVWQLIQANSGGRWT